MKRIFCIVLLAVISEALTSCSSKRNIGHKLEKGFILFTDPDHWYFVPTKSFDERNCNGNFAKANFNEAIQFNPHFENISIVTDALDTMLVDNVGPGYPSYMSSLKIAPVELEYEINESRIAESSIFKFGKSIRGDSIAFKYNVLPIAIHGVRVINCLAGK
ncbi:hypothetical protein [Chryseolinea lacunae]|uniref:Lipid/polyisoprenoid-binding YceI-like domain-containing protein n=1 Tax=Chryseolinea lacunae TaxID=2801331 RepID=A0ABS1KPP8_9BACT|nr:hypothetical protein [Chryseolinea lacunae]MBL0741406.1 hypothetical protein [Chryseolinea lacunae]